MNDTERGVPNIAIGRFWTEFEPVKGGAELQPVDYCEVYKRGTTASVSNKIVRWKKDNPPVWAMIEPSYNAWKKGETELPVDGTPLEAWPAITSKPMIDHLRSLNLKTVEHLAHATSADAERIGMGAVRLITLAKAFVEAKQGTAAVTAELAQRDDKIRFLENQVADMKATIDQLAAAIPKKTPDKAPITKDANRIQ